MSVAAADGRDDRTVEHYGDSEKELDELTERDASGWSTTLRIQ
jgi:hypothetical protein